MNNEIAYRTVDRNAICSVCGKDILRNDEKVLILPCKVHGRSYNIICFNCFENIETFLIDATKYSY